MNIFEAKIIDKKEVAPSTFVFNLDCKIGYEPGQFVMISSPSIPWIIPKPFSILSYDDQDGLSILFKVYGLWTEKFSALSVGSTVNLVGPCGSGFITSLKRYGFSGNFSRILFVAGGVGIASIFSLFKHFDGAEKVLVFGGRTEKDLVLLEKISSLGVQVLVSTEDGSAGFKGRVTDVMQKLDISDFDVILCCGPVPMMKAVSDFAKILDKPLFLAMEERMACGIGICFSCAVKTKNGVKLCCRYGPVFSSDEIAW